MKVDVDWGPDWPEETRIKQQLAEMQRAYQRDAQPLIDRLVEIRSIKMPRMIVWEEAATK